MNAQLHIIWQYSLRSSTHYNVRFWSCMSTIKNNAFRISLNTALHGLPNCRVKWQGADPPPLFLHVSDGRWKSFERWNYPPPPHWDIAQGYSQTISNLGHVAHLRHVNSLYNINESAKLIQGALWLIQKPWGWNEKNCGRHCDEELFTTTLGFALLLTNYNAKVNFLKKNGWNSFCIFGQMLCNTLTLTAIGS